MKFVITNLLLSYIFYFITTIIEISSGFLGFMVVLAFWIFFIIFYICSAYYFNFLTFKNKYLRFLLISFSSLIPLFFTIILFRKNIEICKERLNEFGNKVELYYEKNKKYPENLDAVSTSFYRLINSPHLFIPFPRYKYQTDSSRQEYSIYVKDDDDGGYMISSKYKEARYFE